MSDTTTWVELLDRLCDQPELREAWLAQLTVREARALLDDPAFRLAVDLLRYDIDAGGAR